MSSTARYTRSRPSWLAITAFAATLLAVSTTVLAEPVTIHGTVQDEATGEPVAGALVTILQRDDRAVLAETETDEQGGYSVSGGFYNWLTVVISADGYENVSRDLFIPEIYEPQEYEVDAKLSAVSGPDTPTPSVEPTPSYLLAVAVVSIAVVAATVMYSKIRRENLLKHAVRRRIHDYVSENPGAHYRAILDDLGLSMGVLTYHINRLERGEYLRSRQDGMYRRFFVTGRKTDVKFFLSDVQEAIVATIRENQGISQSGIAERINVSRKVVNYHVNILDQAGLIYMEPKGREMACYMVDRPAGAV